MPSLANQHSLDHFVDKPQSEWPKWLNELIYEVAYKRIPMRALQENWKLSRTALDDFFCNPKIDKIIKGIRAEAFKRLSEELAALQFQSIEVLENILADGKQDAKLKAAIEVLRGLGRLKDHSDLDGRIQVIIDKELVQENK